MMDSDAVISVRSEAHLLNAIQGFAGIDVQITAVHPHPSLSRCVYLWACKKRWRQNRRGWKEAATAAARRRGVLEVSRRGTSWNIDSETIGTALDTVSWIGIRQLVGVSPWGEQLLHRIKFHAFTHWDSTEQCPGCCIQECNSREVGVAHLFWACSGAKKLWGVFFAPWRSLGSPEWFFKPNVLLGLKMSAVPYSIWEIYDKPYQNIPLSDKSEIQQCVHAVAEISWTIGAVTTLQAIWVRKASYFDHTADLSSDRAISLLHGRLRQAYINTRLVVTANASKGRKEAAELMCSALLKQHVGVVTVLRLALPKLSQFYILMGAPEVTQGQVGRVVCWSLCHLKGRHKKYYGWLIYRWHLFVRQII
ncbi:reverse transcriptase [Phytophthora megakarya]|uniref:Reverse transcriptase n=1 Tax=Phytophthora megakarya TaxID=4795 RepID=A0A225W283_9STRA|nr:reverse transcriptase [Phytophthora megakarya]